MVLEANLPDEPLRFIIRSSDPAQPNAFLCQTNTLEEKEEWIEKINSQLDQQKRLLAALVNPKGFIDQSLSKGMNKLSLLVLSFMFFLTVLNAGYYSFFPLFLLKLL